MIGAGFSRNALLPAPNSPQPPLWPDFCRVMTERIHPDSTRAPSDPLRLAEEYVAELGRPALDGLIRDLVRDSEWVPGPLHERLLSLPWRDVLTTNWDTLLEQAAETNDQQTYETVTSITDIPRTRPPRIVKLHGSMPSGPFIFTEEDYRNYRRRFPPFVNLVQEILLENELCLIGFSGDDPNFLQWSGWIRDQLGSSARRIYLVGVLKLSAPRRKLLEAHNVSPIDLAPIVGHIEAHERHSAAAGQFLDFLTKSKPKAASEWSTRASSAAARRPLDGLANKAEVGALVTAVRQLIPIWRQERETYPGWLVCPSSERLIIRLNVSGLLYIGGPQHPLARAVEELEASERAEFLYEMVWRADLAFLPLSGWLLEALGRAARESSTKLTRQKRCAIIIGLLRSAREVGDRGLFDNWAALLRECAGTDEDALASASYEAGLWARDHLDYGALAKLVPTIEGQDPAWKTRRAALYCDLGDFETATNLAREALREIRRRFVRDRKSIWNISRLSWALFLARAGRTEISRSPEPEPLIASDQWPGYCTANKCNPWDELGALDRDIDEAFRAKIEAIRDDRHKFDPGTYSRTVRFSDSLPFARYSAKRLADAVGLPAQLGLMNVMRSRLSRALHLFDRFDKDNLIEDVFGRIPVARMEMPTVDGIIAILWDAVSFGRTRLVSLGGTGQAEAYTFWMGRLRIFVEALSRLVLRLSGHKAIASLRRAAELAKASEWNDFRLFEQLGNLLERSFEAVSPKDRSAVLLDILNLPLPDERGIKRQGNMRGPEIYWPELMAYAAGIGGRSLDESAFAARVDLLIRKARMGDAFTRERAVGRLARLYGSNALSPDEVQTFGQALWSQLESETGFPANTGLLPHAFFHLPGGDPETIQRLFRVNVVEKNSSPTPEFLSVLIGATRVGESGSRVFDLSTSEALSLFDRLAGWVPRDLPFELDGYDSGMKDTIGPALADAVLPFVDLNSLGKDRLERLVAMAEGGVVHSVVAAFPEIVRLNVSWAGKVTELIQRSALGLDTEAVIAGLSAIERWRLLSNAGVLGEVPPQLKRAVVTTVVTSRSSGLHVALDIASRFVSDRGLSGDDHRALADALARLWVETSYSLWDVRDTRTVVLTLIRAGCVRLADSLRRAGTIHDAISHWIDETKDDPLPEVRYALAEA
jgi:tetratricopeptide (TPR) repeat protein